MLGLHMWQVMNCRIVNSPLLLHHFYSTTHNLQREQVMIEVVVLVFFEKN